MTLTYKVGLDIFPLDLHAKIQVRMSVRSDVRARWTDRHTNDVKTITPITSETWGVINNFTDAHFFGLEISWIRALRNHTLGDV